MTLHEVAEHLRKVAFDLDGAFTRWELNDRHVEMLDRTIANLTTRLAHAERRLATALFVPLKRTRPKRRPAKKKAKR